MSKRRSAAHAGLLPIAVCAMLVATCSSEQDPGHANSEWIVPTTKKPLDAAPAGSEVGGGGCVGLRSGVSAERATAREIEYDQPCTVAVDTDPPHAIAISTEDRCTTPCRLAIPGNAKEITLTKEGYETVTVPLPYDAFAGPGEIGRSHPRVSITLREEE